LSNRFAAVSFVEQTGESRYIAAQGQARCIGSLQHLKNRFGGGYVLEARLLPPGEALVVCAFMAISQSATSLLAVE